MINCLVRSLRRRRPSIRADVEGATGKELSDAVAGPVAPAGSWPSDQAPASRPSGVGVGEQAVDRLHPDGAGLLERQAEELPHARPAFEVGERFERDQRSAGARRRQASTAPARYISSMPHDDQLARSAGCADVAPAIALVDDSDAPQRQPALAGLAARLDLGADAGRAGRRRASRDGASAATWAIAWSVAATLQAVKSGKRSKTERTE